MSDPCVANRENRYWIYLAGQAHGYGATEIYSASLPSESPLSGQGWTFTRNPAGELEPLAGHSLSGSWDGKGGRHCPSYVRGWDPREGAWVERIYYAGAAEKLWGPYTIGFLQWDGAQWVDQAEPAFVANEEWEHGSVYEPNLVYHDGRWKIWYVAGSNHEGLPPYMGMRKARMARTGWTKHEVFASSDMKMLRLLCPSARQRIRCDLRARLGPAEAHRLLRRGCGEVPSPDPIGKALRLEHACPDYDGRRLRLAHRSIWKPSRFNLSRQLEPGRCCSSTGLIELTIRGHFRSRSPSGALRLICRRICIPSPAPTFADSEKRSVALGTFFKTQLLPTGQITFPDPQSLET